MTVLRQGTSSNSLSNLHLLSWQHVCYRDLQAIHFEKQKKKITPNVLWDLDLGTLQKKQLRSVGQDNLSVICL